MTKVAFILERQARWFERRLRHSPQTVIRWDPDTRQCRVSYKGRVLQDDKVPEGVSRILFTLNGREPSWVVEKPLADLVAREALTFGFTPEMRLPTADKAEAKAAEQHTTVVRGEGFVFVSSKPYGAHLGGPWHWWAAEGVQPEAIRLALELHYELWGSLLEWHDAFERLLERTQERPLWLAPERGGFCNEPVLAWLLHQVVVAAVAEGRPLPMPNTQVRMRMAEAPEKVLAFCAKNLPPLDAFTAHYTTTGEFNPESVLFYQRGEPLVELSMPRALVGYKLAWETKPNPIRAEVKLWHDRVVWSVEEYNPHQNPIGAVWALLERIKASKPRLGFAPRRGLSEDDLAPFLMPGYPGVSPEGYEEKLREGKDPAMLAALKHFADDDGEEDEHGGYDDGAEPPEREEDLDRLERDEEDRLGLYRD